MPKAPAMFIRDDGSYSPLPPSREVARYYRKTRYDDQAVCTVCNECSIKYTANGECIHCSRLAAIDYYNVAVATLGAKTNPVEAQEAGHDAYVRLEPCEKYGHVGLLTLNGMCYECHRHSLDREARATARRSKQKWYNPHTECPMCRVKAPRRVSDNTCQCQTEKKPSPRQAAIDAGEKWYMPEQPCQNCGQTALRRVNNGQCQGCVPPRQSPRQAAIDAGEKWYMPDLPCSRCNQIAPRRVDNGQCQGCNPNAGTRVTDTVDPVSIFGPDAIISKEEAKTAGLSKYRTGHACNNGHTGWRYVSTGNCCDCLKEARNNGTGR